MDDLEYLQPSFDPHKVTVPRLRSILVDRQIEYPSSAKKTDLINLYEQHIRPNAATWLQEYKHSLSMDVSIEGPESPNRSSRKSSRNATPEKRTRKPKSPKLDQTVPQKRGSEESTPKRKKLARKKRNADESGVSDDAESPTVSRIEKSVSAGIKSPLSLEKFEGEELVAGDDISEILSRLGSPQRKEVLLNPANESNQSVEAELELEPEVQLEFEEVLSGPSRLLDPTFKDDEHTLKSLNDSAHLSEGSEGSLTDVEQEIAMKEEAVAVETEAKVDTSETEIKDEEVAEVEVEVPVPAETTKPESKGSFKYALLLLPFVASLLGYRSMAVDVGFCGREGSIRKVGSYITSDLPQISHFIDKTDAFLDSIKPACVPCPAHAMCDYDSRIECESGYTVSQPWQSVFGLVPRMQECVYDSKRLEKIRLMTEFTLGLLRRKNGKEMTLEELHNFLKATKSNGMDDEDFEEYWYRFVTEEISKEPEIVVDFTTSSISIQNKVPSQFLTRTPGKKSKKTKLFQQYPVPTSTFGGYSMFGN
ncbi:hypothetical protein OGAPHI_001147 [Ogataea philodendri]|uniref:Uncharacterized protein n=1 Tax=Ogataea philodendri TaxID=1378263 RepID=A0A9P8PG42_9ASCO|nr:uncharacterized protein OGAPHI_001147 [Ogataea philodendri]KAH3670632.1 hypothetical protein OGAPHI_001147 [Ogataea philodendri]